MHRLSLALASRIKRSASMLALWSCAGDGPGHSLWRQVPRPATPASLRLLARTVPPLVSGLTRRLPARSSSNEPPVAAFLAAAVPRGRPGHPYGTARAGEGGEPAGPLARASCQSWLYQSALITVGLTWSAATGQVEAATPGPVPTAVAAPTVSLSSDAAMASQVTYTVGFTTSAQGGLAANQGSITLVAPEGTVFPLAPGVHSVTAGATKVSSLIYGNPSIAGGGSVVSVTVSTAVGAGQALTLAVTAVTNPGDRAVGVTVETSSDTQAVSTPSYRLAAATAVAAPTVSLSSGRRDGVPGHLHRRLHHQCPGRAGGQPGQHHLGGAGGDGLPPRAR